MDLIYITTYDTEPNLKRKAVSVMLYKKIYNKLIVNKVKGTLYKVRVDCMQSRYSNTYVNNNPSLYMYV